MLGQPGICDINDAVYRNTEDHLKVEVFCNHAAGAALVPQEKLLSSNIVRSHGSSPNWAYPELIHLANSFMVNQEVVLRRLLVFGKTTSNFYDYWRKKIGEYETVTKPKGSPREKAFLKALRTQGEGYVRLVLNALHNNTITVSRASDYLDLKVQHFSELEAAVE